MSLLNARNATSITITSWCTLTAIHAIPRLMPDRQTQIMLRVCWIIGVNHAIRRWPGCLPRSNTVRPGSPLPVNMSRRLASHATSMAITNWCMPIATRVTRRTSRNHRILTTSQHDSATIARHAIRRMCGSRRPSITAQRISR